MLPGPSDLRRCKRANTTRTGVEQALLFGLIHLRYKRALEKVSEAVSRARWWASRAEGPQHQPSVPQNDTSAIHGSHRRAWPAAGSTPALARIKFWQSKHGSIC